MRIRIGMIEGKYFVQIKKNLFWPWENVKWYKYSEEYLLTGERTIFEFHEEANEAACIIKAKLSNDGVFTEV